MSLENWEDLLYDLASDMLTADEKADQRHKLAAHMAGLEGDLRGLKRRVANLEKDLSE